MAQSLVPWIILMCDSMIIPDFLRERAYDPEAHANLVTDWERWAMYPVRGLVEELRRCHWPLSTLLNAVRMAEAKTCMKPELQWIRRWAVFCLEAAKVGPVRGETNRTDRNKKWS